MKRRPESPRHFIAELDCPLGDHLYSAAIVICDSGEAIADGALRVRSGRIAAVGKRLDFPKRPDLSRPKR